MKIYFIFAVALSLWGCTGIPEKVQPVQNFQADRYLGKWYEIARLDHSFERGLENVSAEYALREDGGISVLNSGYSPKLKDWKSAKGKAYFVKNKDEGYLKVSFFSFFYGSYIIFGLDKERYEYAFVSGPNKSYLWLLARQPNPPKTVIDEFKLKAQTLGFPVDKLIFVKHDELLYKTKK